MQSMSGGGFTYNRFDAYEAQLAESKKASKDYDGDGKVESSKDEYFGSKDKAIKKAMGKGTCKKCEESEEDCGCDDKKEMKENAGCGSKGYQMGGTVGYQKGGEVKKKKVVKEDVILHLIDEGYVNNEVSAEVLFDNISDEFLESIEDDIMEIYQGRHGMSDKEYMDNRSTGGKMISGDSKMSGAKFAHGRRANDGGAGPNKPGVRPKAQGKMDRGTRIDLDFRRNALKNK